MLALFLHFLVILMHFLNYPAVIFIFQSVIIPSYLQLFHIHGLLNFMYWWQETWSPKLSYCDHWGHLCFEWKVKTSPGPPSVCNRWSSLWPCQTGFAGHTPCWPTTRTNNSANIWNGLFVCFSENKMWSLKFSTRFFSTGLSNVQGLYRAGSPNCPYKNHQQV